MSSENLSSVQTDKLREFSNALYERVNRQNEDERLYADLTGLYNDIIRELSKSKVSNAELIFDYASLLLKEISLYCNEKAYIMGLESKGVSTDEVLARFQFEIETDKNDIDTHINKVYADIASRLGSSKGLISDFTDIFQTVHGVTKNHLRDFISFGQNSSGTEGVA